MTKPTASLMGGAVVTPDAADRAALVHDLRAALSDVLGGLQRLLPEDGAAQAGLRQAGSELARLMEQGLTLLERDSHSLLPLAPPAPDLPLPDLGGLRLALAEGNGQARDRIAADLARMGAEVVFAPDAAAATALLYQGSADLALIDMELPGPPVAPVIRALRSLPGPRASRPVLAMTAFPLRANRLALLAAGVDEVLAKPLAAPAGVGQAILSVLRPALAETEMDTALFGHLMDLAGPDTAPELLDRLARDLSGIERHLVRAFTQVDWVELRGQSHVLIAVAGAVGAVALQHLAEDLNRAAHAQDSAALTTLHARLMPRLDTLIQFVADQRGAA